ncbi:tripartite tricarboxylate transporter substrate binding protein [Ramlibacter sp. AN1015]|uniref:Bug family tripartite tricarboxylate transporter substrate binding protein n=1 Tax=Ramlibacter sp. AN1015 TaxID=3133428 RepID=UPI0030BE0539
MPVLNLDELVTYSKANPGKVNFGSVGIGSSAHFVTEYFKSRTGADLTHVPYAGAPAILQAALRGDVHLLMETPALVKSQVEDGKLRALAVTGDSRYAPLAQVPSTKEAGVPDLDFGFWMGVFAPKGTPPATVSKLNAVLTEIVKSPGMRNRLTEMGYVPVGSSSQQFSERVDDAITRFTRIALENKLRIQE